MPVRTEIARTTCFQAQPGLFPGLQGDLPLCLWNAPATAVAVAVVVVVAAAAAAGRVAVGGRSGGGIMMVMVFSWWLIIVVFVVVATLIHVSLRLINI